MKTIIERGASWTLEETKLLLSLWGQDLIQRQSTNAKRSKEVYEKISEKFSQNGFERTPDQVRTRVFNMIAEYRRILKDPNPERMKKCIFYEPLHRIYHARSMDEIKIILDEYEPEYPCSPSSNTVSSEKGEESISDGDYLEGNDTANHSSTTNVTASANASAQTNSNSGSSSVSNNDKSGSASVANNTQSSDNTDITVKEEKETPAAASQTGTKRIRLDSPKSNQQNQANQTSSASTTTGANSTAPQDSSATPSTSSKQASKSTSVPLLATTIGGAPITSSSTIRQQSLLMPHATASAVPSTSTPIPKLAASVNNNTPSYININSTKLPIIRTNQLIGHSNGNESINLNGTATRLPTTAAITSHQLYQAPVNTFDVTSSALLIDRMFAHLSRESENMREWIALEKERLAIEKTRRQQETEREYRRERALMDTLMKFQDNWLAFLSRIDPKLVESLGEGPPALKDPHFSANDPSLTAPTHLSHNTATYSMLSSNNANTSSSTSKPNETDKQ